MTFKADSAISYAWIMASYFERDRQDLSPLRAGSIWHGITEAEFGRASLTNKEAAAIKAQGDAPVSLSKLGIRIKDGEVPQIQAVWAPMGVILSIDEKTGDVVFPGKQIDAVGQALIDTQYILYDHFDRGKGNPNTR